MSFFHTCPLMKLYKWQGFKDLWANHCPFKIETHTLFQTQAQEQKQSPIVEKKEEASINMVSNIISKSKALKEIAIKEKQPLEDKGPHEWVKQEILDFNGQDGTTTTKRKKTYGVQ